MSPIGTAEEILNIIRNKLLYPVYQPIFNLHKANLYGYEALIRGPLNSSLHTPINLFQTAHQLGHLSELEYACRETSCHTFATLKGPGKLFINVSPMSLVESGYQQGMTHKILEKIGLSPDRIVIELSEQYPLDDYEVIRQATLHFRNMGFEIAIDDLGSGYAGLRVWEELRPDYVKIDRHFIENIDTDKAKQEFVSSIQKIALGLSCQVVAEGIETIEQLVTVRKLGIPFGQGYYLGRPESHLHVREPQGLRNEPPCPRTKAHYTVAGELAEQAKTVVPSATFESVIELFRRNKKLICLPVLADEFVVGNITRNDMLERMASPYTRELYLKKKARDFMNSEPVTIEYNSSLEEAGNIISQQNDEQIDSHFIVTNNGRFVGVARTRHLLGKLTELQLQHARHANPLTGLPGNLAIDQTLDNWLNLGIEFHVAYLDLNHFKPFNDYYGYKAGDEVIGALAEITEKHINPEQDFVGHVGGDDFVILYRSINWRQRCEDIIQEFDQSIPFYYDEEARRRGGIEGVDRRGENRFYPILGLAIGLVHPDPAFITSYHDIAALAADAKHCAKQHTQSHLFISRRRKPHHLSPSVSHSQPYTSKQTVNAYALT